MTDEFDSLIGKKIISIEQNGESLRFNLHHNAVVFNAVGDCCSSSYIESIDDPDIFNDATLLSVESVKGKQTEIIYEDGYGEAVHKWTFYKFKTDKGMATLSFRNESNGYYNGRLEKVE